MGDIDAGKILAEKAVRFDKDWPMFQDIGRFRAMLAKVETALDEIEKELSHLCAKVDQKLKPNQSMFLKDVKKKKKNESLFCCFDKSS